MCDDDDRTSCHLLGESGSLEKALGPDSGSG